MVHLAHEVGQHVLERAVTQGLGEDGRLARRGDQDLGRAGLLPDVCRGQVLAEVPLDEIVDLRAPGFPALTERLSYRLQRHQEGLTLVDQIGVSDQVEEGLGAHHRRRDRGRLGGLGRRCGGCVHAIQ